MKTVFYTILALCCLLPVQAQNTLRDDSLLNRELTLEKEYSATIRDAVKFNQLPALREPQVSKSPVEFSNYSVPYAVQPKLIPLDPKAYLTDVNYSKYKGYLTGGISSLIDIDGDLGYQILNTHQDRMNIFFSHRSSRSNVSYLQDVSYLDESGKQKFKINDNWGGLNYMHDFYSVKLFADAKYTYSAFNYYGLSIPSTISYFLPGPQPNNNFDKNTHQVNNMFEAHLGLSSEEASELNYKIKINYTNFQQKYGNRIDESGSKENRFLIDGSIFKMFSTTMGLGLSGSVKTYLYSNEMFKSLNDSTTNYWVYSLNSYFYYENNKASFLLGIKMDADIGGLEKVTWSPNVRFNFFFNNQFMFYLLAGGERKDNSQYNLFYENRYVDPFIRVMDSRSPLDATVGVKFTPISTMSVDIFGGYKITKDEHFYYSTYGYKYHINGTQPMLSGNWITPIYEDADAFKIGADIKYAYQNIFELNLKGTYYQWNISTTDDILTNRAHRAWNKPDFEMNVSAGYRIPWLPLRFDVSYLSAYGKKAANPFISLSDVSDMNDIHDLSLKGTYSFAPDFSVYASLNNLLFSKYDIWWGYPAQSFSIMGGLSFLF